MGLRHSILFALPWLLATPAFAQDNNAGPVINLPRPGTPPADAQRQGPELDVFRAPATEPVPVTPPPVAPPIAPTLTPTPSSATAPAAPRPTNRAAPAPAPSAPATRTEQPAPRPAAPAPNESAPESAPVTQAPPQAAPAPTPLAPTPAPKAAAEPTPPSATPWGWIAAGLGIVLIAFALLRRRRPEPEAIAEAPVPAQALADTALPDAAIPAPPPPSPLDIAPEPEADRPWLDLTLEIKSARYSLMGATIAYELGVHNRGAAPAEDILIRVLLANAGTAQQAALDQFLGGTIGLPAHSVASLAPGEGQWLNGELRLAPDDIAPLQVGERALLVPLALFDAHYRWSEADEGRLARSFLVGQEPAQGGDRLAPLRMDMGPRQYRQPAARVVGDLLRR